MVSDDVQATWLLAAAVYSGVATAQSPTMEQRTEAFAEVSAAMTLGNQTGAADASQVIEDPNWAMFEGEAHARLAVQLNKLDLPYAALLAYAKAMAADPEGVGSEAGKAVDLADKVGDQAVLSPCSPRISVSTSTMQPAVAWPTSQRENHRAGQLATAAAILKPAASNDPYYPEAKALEGVILSLQKRHGDALAPLQIALAVGGRAKRGELFKSVVQMNLARAYYAAGNLLKPLTTGPSLSGVTPSG